MSESPRIDRPYRGRLAPSPTGCLHLGHACMFWIAQQRAQEHSGSLILRNEDLDRSRCKKEFVAAMFEDLRWFGFEWQEGPDCGGPYGPYDQSERLERYRAALEKLQTAGFIYPCICSRKDILDALAAPHEPAPSPVLRPPSPPSGEREGVRGRYTLPRQATNDVGPPPERDDEPIYPGTCRSNRKSQIVNRKFSWRFRVPDGESISFVDGHYGPQQFAAGKDFGDFVVWRHDDMPAYQLAVVVDDTEMQVTEVVRGADLLLSTARQLLLYRALEWDPPAFYHCPLMTDERGVRLAKRHDSLSLRALRKQGKTPETLREEWNRESFRPRMDTDQHG